VETPGTYNITAYQGASFDLQFVWKIDDNPVNITGYTARMQARRRADSVTAAITLTNENGRIALGGSAGTITLDVSADDMEEVDAAEYVYDLELESAGGEVYRLLEGKFTVSAEVTRD
jgi:hypothetical protein